MKSFGIGELFSGLSDSSIGCCKLPTSFLYVNYTSNLLVSFQEIDHTKYNFYM